MGGPDQLRETVMTFFTINLRTYIHPTATVARNSWVSAINAIFAVNARRSRQVMMQTHELSGQTGTSMVEKDPSPSWDAVVLISLTNEFVFDASFPRAVSSPLAQVIGNVNLALMADSRPVADWTGDWCGWGSRGFGRRRRPALLHVQRRRKFRFRYSQ
jgi:hypothetical protein